MPWCRASRTVGTASLAVARRSWKARALKRTRQPMRRAAARSFSWSALAMMSGDATGQAGVGGDRTGGLFEGVTDDAGGRSHLVDAFEVQGKRAQFIGEFADGAVPDGRLLARRSASAVQPPLEVGGLKPGLGVFRMPKLAGVEDAEGSEGVPESRSGGHRVGL